MKYSFNCQKCKSKEVYEPRKELPKDPHTRCTQCGHTNHLKSGDLKELKRKVAQQKRKSIQPDKKNIASKINQARLQTMSIKAKLKLFGETALDDYLLTGSQTRSFNKALDILMKPEFIEQGEIVSGVYWTSETPPYKRPEFLYDHQEVAIRLMTSDHLLWQASRQLAGKTTAGLLKDMEDMLDNPNYTVALVAPSIPLATELLFKFFYSPIEYQGQMYSFYDKFRPYMIKDPNSLGVTFKNGSRLLIISLKQSSSQGRTINVIHIEELDKLSTEEKKRIALAGIINSLRANKNAKVRIFCNMPKGIFRLLKSELFKYGHYFNIYIEDPFLPGDDYTGAHTIVNENVIVEKPPKLDDILSIFSEILVSAAFAEAQLYNVEDFTDEVFNPDKVEIAYSIAKLLDKKPIYFKTTMGIDPGGKVDAFGCSIWSLTKAANIELRWCKRYFNAKHTAKEQAKEIARQIILYKVEKIEVESSAGSPWSISLIEHYVNKYSDGKIRVRIDYINFQGDGKPFDKNNFVYLFKILLDYERLILHERGPEERALHHQIIKYIINKSESNNNPDDLVESGFHGVWILLGGMDYVDKITDRIKSPIGETTKE